MGLDKSPTVGGWGSLFLTICSCVSDPVLLILRQNPIISLLTFPPKHLLYSFNFFIYTTSCFGPLPQTLALMWRMTGEFVHGAEAWFLFIRPLCTRTREFSWEDMSYYNNASSGIKRYFGEKTDCDRDKLSNCQLNKCGHFITKLNDLGWSPPMDNVAFQRLSDINSTCGRLVSDWNVPIVGEIKIFLLLNNRFRLIV